MNSKKKITMPTIITIIFICIIIYLFTNIKQSKVVCEKTTTFDSDIKLEETVVSFIDNKNIRSLFVQKKILLPENFNKKEENINLIKNTLEYHLDYLGDNVTYSIDENSVVADIKVNNNELVLLDNIELFDNDGELNISINPNTKSSDVVSLKVGDSYTDGELMKRLKNNGYYCK